MNEYNIRNVATSDYAQIETLNELFVHFTSPLDQQKINLLDDLSSYHRVIEQTFNNNSESTKSIEGFLLVVGPDKNYESENYKWFDGLYNDFLYIDRIVINTSAQRHGLGKQLYKDLFSFAKTQGFQRICCEYNIKPANENSAKFHEAFGFKEVGRLTSNNRNKIVSMQMVELD